MNTPPDKAQAKREASFRSSFFTYRAMTIIGAVLVFPPEGGAAEIIAIPDFLTTNIAFGGPDGKTAYVTMGSTGRVAMIDWDVPGLELAFH